MKTKVKIDWYSADIEMDIYCKCGKHFVCYKESGEDDFLIQCPKCLTYYRAENELSFYESEPDERGDIILSIDENSLPDWK